MNGPMNILDSAKHVISFGTGLDYRLKGLKALQVQGYFQVHLARERVLDNTEELLFGVIRTGGEVYSTGINITIHL